MRSASPHTLLLIAALTRSGAPTMITMTFKKKSHHPNEEEEEALLFWAQPTHARRSPLFLYSIKRYLLLLFCILS
jgi:hypothetical protein